MADFIELKTRDGFLIAADHYKGPKGSPCALLLHMYPETKESWKDFAEKLNQAGFGALAIDFRGHGQSQKGPGGYRVFSEEETKQSIEDVWAGLLYQKKEGHAPRFIIGASIGANFALQAISQAPDLAGGVLLSPGINYHGVETTAFAQNILPHQVMMIIAARDDMASGWNVGTMAEDMGRLFRSKKKKIEIFDTGGHGIHLFATHPELQSTIIAWLQKQAGSV